MASKKPKQPTKDAHTDAPPSTDTDTTQLPTDATPDAPGSTLNPKQRLFYETWAATGDRTKAYLSTYIGAKVSTARKEGARLAQHPRGLAYLNYLRTSGRELAKSSLEALAARFLEVANFDYSTICNEAGDLLPRSQWPDGAGRIIQGVTASAQYSNRAAKIPDRIAALRSVAEIRGLLGANQQKNAPAATSTFVFNFGAQKAKRPAVKVVHGEVIDQDAVANIAPVPAYLQERKSG